MRRITRPLYSTLLVISAGLAILFLAAACGDDDDDDSSEETVEEEADADEESDDEQDADSDDGEDDGGEIDTSPSNGAEYLEVYTDIANDLQGDFGEECVDAIDIGDLDFTDVEIPEQCEDYFDEFAGRLDEVEPPDACADLHELLVGVLESLAAGETDAFEDLLGGGDDDQPSEGIISASVDCSGL